MTRISNPLVRQTWQARIDAHAASGLTVAQFCSQQGCSVAGFYFWKRRLSQANCVQELTGPVPAFSSQAFVQLHAQITTAAGMGIELTLPGGASAKLPLDPLIALQVILQHTAPHTKN